MFDAPNGEAPPATDLVVLAGSETTASVTSVARSWRPGLNVRPVQTVAEAAELLSLEDPTTEDFGSSFENYGGGKALCEAAAEAAVAIG